MTSPAAIVSRGLRLGYGGFTDVVAGVDFSLSDGESIAILGPSGGGKTTLLRAVAGILPPRGGILEVLGHMSPSRPKRGSVGYIPQRLGLMRHVSALENILRGGMHLQGLSSTLLRQAPSGLSDRAEAIASDLGLSDKLKDPVHRLSGGQQRRVAIARALLQRPKLLLADEFLGELDPQNMEVVVRAVRTLQSQTGMALLIVEHNVDQAMMMANRLYRLKGGTLAALEDEE